MVQMNLLAKQNRDRDIKQKCMDTKRGRGAEMNWEVGLDTHTHCMYKTDTTNENPVYSTGNCAQYSEVT